MVMDHVALEDSLLFTLKETNSVYSVFGQPAGLTSSKIQYIKVYCILPLNSGNRKKLLDIAFLHRPIIFMPEVYTKASFPREL